MMKQNSFRGSKLTVFMLLVVFMLVFSFALSHFTRANFGSLSVAPSSDMYSHHVSDIAVRLKKIMAHFDGAIGKRNMAQNDGAIEKEKMAQNDGAIGKEKMAQNDGAIEKEKMAQNDGAIGKGKIAQIDGAINVGKMAQFDGAIGGKKMAQNHGAIKERKMAQKHGTIGKGKMAQNLDGAFGVKTKKKKKGKKQRKIKLDDKGYKEKMVFNFTNTWDDEAIAAEEAILQSRAARVTEECQKMSAIEPELKDVTDRMIWSEEHHLVWCPIFKAASTTWVNSFLRMKDISLRKGNRHKQARQLYPMPQDEKERNHWIKTAMKIIIVRHPLDRILSAYRDKMLRVLKKSKDPYREHQIAIFKRYADPELPSELPRKDIQPSVSMQPTFNQFLLKVRDDLKSMKVKGPKKVNLHWRPYYAVCSPCAMNYSVVLKVESFPADQEYLIINRKFNPNKMTDQSHSSNFDKFNSTSEARVAYYSRVPRSLLSEIVQLYLPDFKLFGYSPHQHLNLTFQD